MELHNAVIAIVSILLFFYGGQAIAKENAKRSSKAFLKQVFIIGAVIRIFWVLYGYFYFNMEQYDYQYGDSADTGWYMDFAQNIADWITGETRMSFSDLIKINGSAIDDVGYPFFLAIEYLLSFRSSDILVPFILKCMMSAYCAILIYRIANRHFGEGTARLAALFVALNPNMIYWCNTMFKEIEMVFLCCLFVDLMDRTLTSGQKLTFKGLLPGLLIGLSLFFFRAALGMVAFLAVFAHIVMASNRVLSVGKKIIAGVLVAVTLLIGMGDSLRTRAQSMLVEAQSDNQRINMEWRGKRDGGNNLAKYAGAAVFAPLIFTIPFPSFNVALESQVLQRQQSGGSYIKNIFSYFVICVLIIMLLSGEWRRHVFILAYTVGYLAALVFSNFAQSGRFHMPVWPMLMLFAAYGIQVANRNPKMRRWYTYALVAEVLICIVWNWFKLKGRGMI
jgi:hypothetical protein